MSAPNTNPTVMFLSLAQSKAFARGFITNQSRGLPVYDAIYKERYEAPVSLGLFTSREAASLACERAASENAIIDLSCGELVVIERVLQGSC